MVAPNSQFVHHNDAFFIKVSDDGGGQWYGVHSTHSNIRDITRSDSHRGFVTDGAQNLSLYSFNYERFGTGTQESAQIAVSYTHLTLPTICSV